MKTDNDSFLHRDIPTLIEETKLILDYMKSLSYEDMKKIWKSSDKIARENFDRIKNMDLEENLSPAILSFQGLQYQYMGTEVFTYKELDYIEKHLRILSGFYGILKPLDGILPYRLEMQSKLVDWKYKTLYEFWDDKIAKKIFSESDCIINLASKEYSKTISKYLEDNISFISCTFGELLDGKVIQKGTLAKMARGEMVRFMAEENIHRPEDIKEFNRLDYRYVKDLSDSSNYVFIKAEDKALT